MRNFYIMRIFAALLGVIWLIPFPANAAECRVNPDYNTDTNQPAELLEPTETGILENRSLVETSGIAASKRQDDVFWAINDSGNSATLFAFSDDGRDIGQWPLNARTYDWEDMSSVVIDGKPYLLIADVGDNARNRFVVRIYVFEEPDSTTSSDDNPMLSPVATIRYEYPDGSHNAEAMTTDGEHIYIITKASALRPEHGASGLYRIPMTLNPGPSDEFLMAEFLGTMPIRSDAADNYANGVNILYPTAMEFSPDLRYAYILTYDHVLQVERTDEQNWATGLLRGGKPIFQHSLSQAEALTVKDNGTVWFTTEDLPTPLWALPAP